MSKDKSIKTTRDLFRRAAIEGYLVGLTSATFIGSTVSAAIHGDKVSIASAILFGALTAKGSYDMVKLRNQTSVTTPVTPSP